MTGKLAFLALILAIVILVPQFSVGSTVSPTFDLVTSSNMAGATDATYTLHVENPVQSPGMIGFSIAIPAGYSIGQIFITNTAGIVAMSAKGSCPQGSGTASIVTTTTALTYSLSVPGVAGGSVKVGEPTATSPGAIQIALTGFAVGNSGCSFDLTAVSGFFLNPPTPGTYAWAPSSANPTSGSPVTMAPRQGFSQNVTIVGSATTMTTTSTTEVPEFSSVFILPAVLGLALTLSVAIIRKKQNGCS
jgi:hypothetical protein